MQKKKKQLCKRVIRGPGCMGEGSHKSWICYASHGVENICSKVLGSGQAGSCYVIYFLIGPIYIFFHAFKTIPNCFFGLVHCYCILKFELNWFIGLLN